MFYLSKEFMFVRVCVLALPSLHNHLTATISNHSANSLLEAERKADRDWLKLFEDFNISKQIGCLP